MYSVLVRRGLLEKLVRRKAYFKLYAFVVRNKRYLNGSSKGTYTADDELLAITYCTQLADACQCLRRTECVFCLSTIFRTTLLGSEQHQTYGFCIQYSCCEMYATSKYTKMRLPTWLSPRPWGSTPRPLAELRGLRISSVLLVYFMDF